jgi:hypothetical protein
MSTIMSSFKRSAGDHFEPASDLDPQAHRRLRGQLEQIDYTAFASNQAVIGQLLRHVDGAQLQQMAVATARARSRWVARGLELSETGRELSTTEVADLTRLRQAYEELRDAYEALRRMVERGYISYQAGPAGPGS